MWSTVAINSDFQFFHGNPKKWKNSNSNEVIKNLNEMRKEQVLGDEIKLYVRILQTQSKVKKNRRK